MSHYVTIYEEYKEKFFQLPKVFFTSDRYKDMSNNAKIAWAILRDRSSLSKKNNWFDEDTGRIFFIYKNKELMEILNIKSETTLSKVKKELEDAQLIKQERIGLNKPNKLYLIYPVVDKEDIHKIDEFDNYEYKDEDEDEVQTQSNQGTSKIGAPKNEVPELQKMESINTEYSNTDINTLDTIDTLSPAFSQNGKVNQREDIERERQKYFKKGFYNNHEFIPKELSNVFKVFASSIEKAQMYYQVLLIAKNKVEKELNEFIWLEEHPELIDELVNSFSRAVRKIEKERVIENEKGYLYKAFYKCISDYVSVMQRQSALDHFDDFENWLDSGG